MKTSIPVVDDEQDFLDSVVRMLRVVGYDKLKACGVKSRAQAKAGMNWQ